ncbi:MAG: peptidoglycan-binding protein [Rickettsia sp.]|jgi:hypothetical protein|nr:peptidoglycan-binding protein [Rickettsia sp.]
MLRGIKGTYVHLNSVPLIVLTKGIKVDPQMNTSIDPYVGTWGSNTTALPKKGKHLSFKVYANASNFEEVNSLRYETEPVPFVSESKAKLNSIYIIKKFAILEEDRDQFEIDIELHEHTRWVVESKNFKNWKVDKSKAKPECPKNSTVLVGKSNLKVGQETIINGKTSTVGTGQILVDCVINTSSKASQLKDCAPLKRNNKKTECNKKLQKALKDNNLYILYKGHVLKVDGVFGPRTEDAVREFQKKKKLKPTGIADAKTIAQL